MSVKAVASVRIKEIREEIELEEITALPQNGFKYSGVDSLNRPIRGTVPFNSAEEARDRLEVSGISVTNLSPISSFLKRKRDKRPNVMEMAQLADQFAAQKEIGLTYNRICQILARVHPNLAVQRALNEVEDRILSGQPADQAFGLVNDKKGKPFFPLTFVNAFRIGDDAGAIPDPETDESVDAPVLMLRLFAQAQRKAAEMFKKIKTALVYPTSVIGTVFVAFFIEVYWIVPIFAQIFIGLLQGKDTSLPAPTQLMLDISAFFRSPLGWGTTLVIFAGLGFSIYYYFFNTKGIENRERLVLKLPILKSFFIPFYTSVFCRNLSMMWESEPNLAKRFQTVAETSTNPVYREMCEHISNQVPQGTAIGQLFNGYYHLLGESFAPVAETIENAPGDGQKQLYTYAKFMELEAEEKLDWAIAVLGKAAFMFAAGMVVFILIASYMPLIEMVGRMAK
jgi:type IV pilus assembly protein PilC